LKIKKQQTHNSENKIYQLACSRHNHSEYVEHRNNSKLMIHEATFPGSEQVKKIQANDNRHSYLEGVIKPFSENNIECLIMGNFS